MDTQNDTSLDIELEDLSEKIRQYLSGKSGALLERLSTDGTAIKSKYILVDATQWGYNPEPQQETAYINARDIALAIKRKYPLPKLPQPHESNPIISLQCLLEWCIDNKSKQQPTEASGEKVDLAKKPSETEQEAEGSMLMITVRSSKENWEAIRGEYDISKKDFGKTINFVSDPFKREIIFRDIEHAFVLASQDFSKPALILAGGVIEELLRLYLEHKKIQPKGESFFDYIKACEDNKLLKSGVYRLSDSIRDFRNLVHLKNEETNRHTLSKATAKGAVSSIFTIAKDFQ